jgi:hypothetical protein
MTDLRELLREARDDLLGWASSGLPVDSSAEKRTLELTYRIDAALVQSPAAKPVAWIDPSRQQAFITEEFRGVLRTWANARVVKPDIDLYAAPQPPIGKGEGLQVAGEWIRIAELEEQIRNSIPRELHERLLLVCWQRLREGSTISEAMTFEAWKTLIAEQAEWPDFKRMASEHERGG